MEIILFFNVSEHHQIPKIRNRANDNWAEFWKNKVFEKSKFSIHLLSWSPGLIFLKEKKTGNI